MLKLFKLVITIYIFKDKLHLSLLNLIKLKINLLNLKTNICSFIEFFVKINRIKINLNNQYI